MQSGCNDVVFVYAKIIDENGSLVPTANNVVKFEVLGEAALVGDNPVKCEAGIAAIILKVGESGGILDISATATQLEKDSMRLDGK